jgi:transposase
MAEEAKKAGHEVVVANPREFRLISLSHKKNDRNDARLLGEFGQIKPSMLHPVTLRGTKCQNARTLMRNRKQLVAMRTEMINMIKSAISDLGLELGTSGASNTFHKRIVERIPEELEPAIGPLIPVMDAIATALTTFDRQIDRESKAHFTETAMLRQVDGVGPIMALTFVATIEDASRFPRSRDVGAYAGLVPISRNSCKMTPELSISKRGDAALRQALVNAATYILGPRGKDCDLRRWGLTLQDRGGQRSRAKARIAVARKLAVLLHRLMLTGEVYDPNRSLVAAAA